MTSQTNDQPVRHVVEKLIYSELSCLCSCGVTVLSKNREEMPIDWAAHRGVNPPKPPRQGATEDNRRWAGQTEKKGWVVGPRLPGRGKSKSI
jgi:hypothetical protein